MSRKSRKRQQFYYPQGQNSEEQASGLGPAQAGAGQLDGSLPLEGAFSEGDLEAATEFELDEWNANEDDESTDQGAAQSSGAKLPLATPAPVEIREDGERKWAEFVITESDFEKRADIFLAERFAEFSRVKLRKTISNGNVTVNGEVIKPAFRLYPDQKLVFEIVQELYQTDQHAEDIPLDILFEDEHIIAINKPAGMVVHPAKGHWRGTLTSALLYRFQQLSSVGGANRPGIVHRLDRETSGVILVAKTDQAHMKLVEQFQERTVTKQYFAVVSPAPDFDQDLVDQPIGKHPYQRERMAVRENHETSRPAQTIFKVIRRYQGFAAVHAFPKTGRTHQIRVHMAHVGCPILCDRLYSGRASISESMLQGKTDQVAGDAEDAILRRQALHAQSIQFQHPITGKSLKIEAPLPDDILRTLEALQRLRSL